MTEVQTPRETRIAFAASLTEFAEQREWYSRRASTCRQKAQRLDIAIIAFGALVAALPVIKPFANGMTDTTIALLGICIVVAQGVQRVYRYAEVWPEYRLASERMKREWRLFVNRADPYTDPDPVAQALYVKRLDGIMADEQKIYFDAQNDTRRNAPEEDEDEDV